MTVATESLASRLETASYSIDGVAAFLMDLVHSPDKQVSRMAYSMGDLLERIGADIDAVSAAVAKLQKAEK